MEDVGRAPADVSPALAEPATIPTLDGWIESLMTCKQLAESDVQRLCDKVSSMNTVVVLCERCGARFGHSLLWLGKLIELHRREKFYKTSRTSSQ